MTKPESWVDLADMVDASAVKPKDYVDDEKIIDPEAKSMLSVTIVPEDWDKEMDGDWTAPLIDNPDYTGPWASPKIPNPAYKGEWKHPKIVNPDYGTFFLNKFWMLR